MAPASRLPWISILQQSGFQMKHHLDLPCPVKVRFLSGGGYVDRAHMWRTLYKQLVTLRVGQ